MLEGKKIGEIRKAIIDNIKLVKKTGGERGKKEKEWKLHGVYDSSLEKLGDSFIGTLPNNLEKEKRRGRYGFLENPKIFQIYIEQTLSKKKHDLTAVEFGGPGSQLFRGFTKDFFTKTVGVCLKDIRSGNEKKDDLANNHFVIEGNILDLKNNQLTTEITNKLSANKTDLIISRMWGPLNSIDKHPAILDRIIRNWYSMLSENGLMFIQFDSFVYLTREVHHEVEKWTKVIKEKFPEIDIQLGVNEFRLHKKTGAPEELPRASELFKE